MARVGKQCMRRPSWALSGIDRPLAILKLFLLTLICGFCSWFVPARASVIEMRTAEYALSDSRTAPDDGHAWQVIALPHRSKRPAERDLVGYWYRVHFQLNKADEPVWLLFPKLRSGGTIYLNGFEIGSIPEADLRVQRRWFRPHMFFAPPSALRAGANMISVRFAIREPLTSFGEIYIGPEAEIRQIHDRLLFWENTLTEVISILCLIVGALTLAIWVRRRQEALYGIFGICTLFWGVRTFVFRMPEVPMDYWVAWRFIYYFSTAGFIVFITLFLLRFCGRMLPSLERFLVLYWLLGCVAFLVIGGQARSVMDGWWTLGFLPFTLYSVFVLCLSVRRSRSGSALAMSGAIVFALLLALHDFAVQHGLLGVEEFYLLHLGIPAFLFVMGIVLLERFLETLRLADSMSDQLAAKVAERERELLKTHERMRILERRNAAAEERQRIMQNLHDGVGSQLVTSLMLVRQGGASQSDVVGLLQDCLDDMRLALDSLSADDAELLPVLGSFRARIASRFKAVGLRLVWIGENLPESLQLAPHATLQVLRILQEALANVLKHAQAQVVTVRISVQDGLLRIVVADDGIGLATAAGVNEGRGLGNMRFRAQKVGGTLDIFGASVGTTISLCVPLGLPPYTLTHADAGMST